MKRLVGVVVALILLPAATAEAQEGAPDLEIKENPAIVKADGPGFKVKLSKHDLKVRIDDEQLRDPRSRLGHRAQPAGPRSDRTEPAPVHVRERDVPDRLRDLRHHGALIEHGSMLDPVPPAFGNAFPTIITFVGTLDAVVTNEDGEQFRLMMSDLAHEVMTATSFSSTAPIHAFFVDSRAASATVRRSSAGSMSTARPVTPSKHRRRGHVPSDGDPAGQPRRDGLRAVLVFPFPTTVIMR